MPGEINIKLDVDDLVREEEAWDEGRGSVNVVYFLGVEVGRYDEDAYCGVPEEFSAGALEKRKEKLVRALWALGDPD